ncbi:MAG: 23S rRNA (guanosine(2251)-2'-O)-methyltransferase RlmB [Clostridia bacterium]|nr:23S rRNA (guanosine(2251)-2'-O)-methyltransferase RlmB [Clostridia bacterium]
MPEYSKFFCKRVYERNDNLIVSDKYKDKKSFEKKDYRKDGKKSFGKGGFNKGNSRKPDRRNEPDRRFGRDYSSRNDIPNEELSNGSVPGRNAVRELLKSGRDIEKIFVREGDREGSITVLVAQAIERGIPVIEADKKKLDALCGYEQHQGIVAIASEMEYVSLEDVIAIAEERGEKPLIVICDGISDPHNLGAIIRCAEGAGAHGVILPKRRAAGITPAVVKASAGATEHLAAVKCSNISDTIRKLKDLGFWIFAAEADGTSYTEADYDCPCAIVLGSEEHGVSDIVKKNSDFIVSIPMKGKVNSLNVSTAAAVLLYEAIKQRDSKILR